jgi:hypothetical protein
VLQCGITMSAARPSLSDTLVTPSTLQHFSPVSPGESALGEARRATTLQKFGAGSARRMRVAAMELGVSISTAHDVLAMDASPADEPAALADSGCFAFARAAVATS